jgi:hypothetical protein
VDDGSQGGYIMNQVFLGLSYSEAEIEQFIEKLVIER